MDMWRARACVCSFHGAVMMPRPSPGGLGRGTIDALQDKVTNCSRRPKSQQSSVVQQRRTGRRPRCTPASRNMEDRRPVLLSHLRKLLQQASTQE